MKTDSLWPLVRVALLLLLVIGAVYANSLATPFRYDDLLIIKNNANLTPLSNFKYLGAKNKYFGLFGERTYRPVITAVYLLLKTPFRDNPAAWRLFNLILHFCNCLLLYILLKRAAPDWLAALAVLLFAIHPVHTEIFNIVSSNEELLGGFLCLLAILTYLRTGWKWRLLSGGLYFLSCLVKETFVVLPLLLFLLALRERRLNWSLFREILGYLLLALSFLLVIFYLMKNPNPQTKAMYPGGSLTSALLTFAVALSYYLKLFWLPFGLTPIYDFPAYTSVLHWRVGLALMILIAIVGVIIYGWRRRQWFAFYLGWFFIFLLPTSNIIPYGGVLAERYLYVPLMGLVPGLLLLGEHLWERLGFAAKKWLLSLGAVFFIFLSVLTVRQNERWQNLVALWENIVHNFPADVSARLNLGTIYQASAGQAEKAIAQFRWAASEKPDSPQPYYQLGLLYLLRGEYQASRENFSAALLRKDKFSEPMSYYRLLINLGAACFRQADYAAALRYWQAAREAYPQFSDVYDNLAAVYQRLGQPQLAEQAATQARQIRQRHAGEKYLGVSY